MSRALSRASDFTEETGRGHELKIAAITKDAGRQPRCNDATVCQCGSRVDLDRAIALEGMAAAVRNALSCANLELPAVGQRDGARAANYSTRIKTQERRVGFERQCAVIRQRDRGNGGKPIAKYSK